MKKQEIIVVIPIYKEQPLPSELKSIQNTIQILSNFSIKLVAPCGLKITNYLKLGLFNEQFDYFDTKYFESIAGYNRLLCSKFFYKFYSEYHYLFLIQTDAWIFYDELKNWATYGYDYIGSPWLWRPQINSKKPIINLFWLMKNQVGNGGVTLRNVAKHEQFGNFASFLFKILNKNEDFIWLLVSKITLQFKKPSWDKALKFCIEMNPQEALQQIDSPLPMCVHAFERYDFGFWEKYILDLNNKNNLKYPIDFPSSNF